MNGKNSKTISSLFRDQSGQVIPWVAVMMVALLATAAFALDVGHAMICYRELQASTNAAAMAAVQSLPNTTYTTVGDQYSGETGDKNVVASLPGVSTTVTGYCSSLVKSWGISCLSPSNDNAVVVTQTVSIPTYFAGIFGVHNITLTATAAAAEKGSPRAPYNVAVVVDTTQSMTSSDGGTNCSSTRIYCAMEGVQDLLKDFSPCYTGLASCSGNTPVDEVSLFSFPATSTPSYDYTCPHKGSFTPIAYPDATNASSSTLISDYEILPLANDYRTSDATSTLNSGSNLVLASGYTSGSCGMSAKGGEGTYYAGAINAAQQYLAANTRTNSKNVIILLSDGDASGSTTVTSGSGKSAKTLTSYAANFSASTTYLNSNGSYPSYLDMCQQGISEATAAKNAGTLIYVVAYGAANTSSGYCKTDSPAQNPCTVLQTMSSGATEYFFADGSSASNGCTPPTGGQTSFTSLTSIFSAIVGDLGVARLMPAAAGCTASNTSDCL